MIADATTSRGWRYLRSTEHTAPDPRPKRLDGMTKKWENARNSHRPTTPDQKLPLHDLDQCNWHFEPIFAYVVRQSFIEDDCHGRSVEKAK